MIDQHNLDNKSEFLFYAKIVKKILDYRKEKNISQEELSKIIDLPINILNDIENMNRLNIGLLSLIFERLGLILDFDVKQKNIEG